MADIRPCRTDDLEHVVRLFLRAFRKGSSHSVPAATDYFQRLYFANPWADDALPSLVAEGADGIMGFIGVVPLPVRVDGVTFRVAVGGNLMVDPEVHDPMVAARLLRRYFAGPQDLAFTDTANEHALRLWASLGGRVGRFPSMRWVLPLRAGALGLAGVRRATSSRVLAALGRAVVWPVDRLGRGRLLPAAPALTVHEVAPATIQEFSAAVGDRGYAHPDVDAVGFQWLIDMCRQKQQFGPLRLVRFADGESRTSGVAAYYPNEAGLGQVVLLQARDGAHADVLDALALDAAAHGSAALVGQADPRLMVALGARASTYVQRNEFVTVLPGRSPEAAAAATRLAAGDVSMSRLVGEWWTRMQGDVF